MEGVKPVSRWALGLCDALPPPLPDKDHRDPRQHTEDALDSLFEDSQQQRRVISQLEARVVALESRLGAVERAKNPLWGEEGDSVFVEKDSGVLDYTIGESVWDAPLIAGLRGLGVRASLVLFASLVVNTVVQVFICTTLLYNKSFTGRSFSTLTKAAERWRDREGHQSSSVDASGISLVSRLCFQDAALSVAGAQSTLLNEINDYHQFADKLSLQPASMATGPTLCAVCIFLHSVVVMSELRKLRDEFCAVYSLPRGFTQVEDGKYIAISRTRLFCVFLTSLIRCGVAIALLYTGIKWLSSTSSVSEMILNAAALGFIMDLDEHLFDMAAPAVVKSFRNQLKPLPIAKPPYLLEALAPLAGVLAIVAVSTVSLITPVAQEMLEVKRALCGGNLDFAMAQNPAGFVVVKSTTPFNSRGQEDPATIRVTAVREYKGLDLNVLGNMPQYSVRSNSDWSFNRDAEMTVQGLSEVMARCFDMDTFNGGSLVKSYPHWWTTIRESTGLHAGRSLQAVPFRCTEYFGFCDKSPLLRSRCPVTCGCHDRRSGLLLAEAQQGCPQVCVQLADTVMEQLPCNDTDVVGTPEWVRYWNSYADTLGAYYGNTTVAGILQRYAERKIEAGCADDSDDPMVGVDACESQHPVYVLNGISSISGFCPDQCCVRATDRSFPDMSDCPASCQR